MTLPDGITLHVGDCLDVLRTLPDASVNCCVTSPPYWGLRDYGHDGQIGLEETPDAYVAKMVEVFREVRRVLRDDGTCWINLGDSYSGSPVGSFNGGGFRDSSAQSGGRDLSGVATSGTINKLASSGLKPKDLVGIPWRVAFALQADGWWLRQDIIWCLSGGTWLYVRTDEGGICLMTVKDMARLNPETVRLWNGKEWTRLLGMSKSRRKGDELTITLRSGERISCTPTHRFPSSRGIVEASTLQVGDRLERVRLPEPTQPMDSPELAGHAAWLCGLYLAEGSRSGDTIQISGHTKERYRWHRCKYIAAMYGGTATLSESGNNQTIRLYGKVLNGIIDQFVSGRTAIDKCFSPAVWRYSNLFVEAMLRGYLEGDGHFDEKNDRWRLGFCRNHNLERDLRTACARLGYRITLNLATVQYKGKRVPSFKGEIKTHDRVGHHNEKCRDEIVSIKRSRCRDVYDLGVVDDPHLFALASGILTHNSKPNPMPESVTDRCTKAHEYVFLLSKRERYWYDADAIKEKAATAGDVGGFTGYQATAMNVRPSGNQIPDNGMSYIRPEKRNLRSVWTITTKPYAEAHFATFPEELPRTCILAGCPVGGTVLDPFAGSGTTLSVAHRLGRKAVGIELNPEYAKLIDDRVNETHEEHVAVPLFEQPELFA